MSMRQRPYRRATTPLGAKAHYVGQLIVSRDPTDPAGLFDLERNGPLRRKLAPDEAALVVAVEEQDYYDFYRGAAADGIFHVRVSEATLLDEQVDGR